MKKKLIGVLLTVFMAAAWLPAMALAENNGSGSESDPYVVTTWDELQDKITASVGPTHIKLGNDIIAPKEQYDIKIDIDTGKNIILDLNGKTFDINNNNSGFLVQGEMTLKDSVGNGKITGSFDFGDAVWVSFGTFVMESGSITGNGGNAIDGQSHATIIVRGSSKITGNNGSGVVLMFNSSLTLAGSPKISGNQCGDVYVVKDDDYTNVVIDPDLQTDTKFRVSLNHKAGVFAEHATEDKAKFFESFDKEFQVVYANGQLQLVKTQKMNDAKIEDESGKQEKVQDQSAKVTNPKTGFTESHTDFRIIFGSIALTIAGLSLALIRRRTDGREV